MLRALVVCSVDADAKIPDLFRMLAERGFQITHCTSTDDAVRRYFAKTQHQLPAPDKNINERCFFDVVITKLGRESQGSAMNGNQLLQAVQACHGKRSFLVVWSFSATADAAIRWHLCVNGANMVTHDLGALRRVLVKVAWIKLTGTLVADPSVKDSSLSTLPTLGDVLREVGSGAAGKSAEKEDQRQPVQTPGGEDRDMGADISRSSPSSSPGVEQRSVGITATGGTPIRPLKMTCPVCLSKGQRVHREENLQYHIRNAHGPCDPTRAGEHQLRFLSEYTTSQRPPSLNAFALVVCIDPGSDSSASTSTPTPPSTSGKLLLVQEFASSGYWLPGGRVDAGESLESAAIRECEEEAGVAIELVGVLQVQYRNSPSPSVGVRLRVIFFARPKAGRSRVPKTIPDYESAGACWIRLDDPELEKLPYRGSEPIFWANYIRNGGAVYPMALISGREN
eukprot:g3355.t1